MRNLRAWGACRRLWYGGAAFDFDARARDHRTERSSRRARILRSRVPVQVTPLCLVSGPWPAGSPRVCAGASRVYLMHIGSSDHLAESARVMDRVRARAFPSRSCRGKRVGRGREGCRPPSPRCKRLSRGWPRPRVPGPPYGLPARGAWGSSVRTVIPSQCIHSVALGECRTRPPLGAAPNQVGRLRGVPSVRA